MSLCGRRLPCLSGYAQDALLQLTAALAARPEASSSAAEALLLTVSNLFYVAGRSAPSASKFRLLPGKTLKHYETCGVFVCPVEASHKISASAPPAPAATVPTAQQGLWQATARLFAALPPGASGSTDTPFVKAALFRFADLYVRNPGRGPFAFFPIRIFKKRGKNVYDIAVSTYFLRTALWIQGQEWKPIFSLNNVLSISRKPPLKKREMKKKEKSVTGWP